MAITIEDMRSTLLSLDTVKETIATSEPLAEYPIAIGDTAFVLEPGWNHELDALDGMERVKASVRISGSEFRLSKDAILQATSAVGLPAAYVKKTPHSFIEEQLNYWYGGALGSKELKMLVTKGTASALTRASINPFSNVRLLEEVLAGVEDKYGKGEVLVDSKFHHSLQRTHMRLILPGKTFTVEDTGTSEDIWSVGLNINNSLTGANQTSVDGYLFRWWCTNGAIDTHASSGVWSRRTDGQDSSEVYEWARVAVDSVLHSMESAQESLQLMARTPIGSNVHQILREIFETHKVPVRDRKVVIDNLVQDDQLTMYSLMQAITSVANNDELDPREQAALMSVGGNLAHQADDRCDSCHRLIPAE
jgi:hypothetical protein